MKMETVHLDLMELEMLNARTTTMPMTTMMASSSLTQDGKGTDDLGKTERMST